MAHHHVNADQPILTNCMRQKLSLKTYLIRQVGYYPVLGKKFILKLFSG